MEAQDLVFAVRKQARNAEESGETIEDATEQTEDDIEAIAVELDTLLSNAEAIEAGKNVGSRESGAGKQGDDLVVQSAPTEGNHANARRSA